MISAQPTLAKVITVWGPSSLSNLGPGFDALGLCLAGWGDRIHATLLDRPGVEVALSNPNPSWDCPLEGRNNTAAVAAASVLEACGVSDRGLRLEIEKGVPPGSGLGSSSSSAVAGGWAANLALGKPLSKASIVNAVLDGEQIASGGRHGDNVLPALLGGLVLVSASDPCRYRQVSIPDGLHIALILPDVQILTKQARAMLPQHVSLRDAVHNASELAFMIDAFRSGDWVTVGQCMMADRLVEPVRSTLLPCYDAVRSAALEAGAYGCALSGSGPALFAITSSPAQAEEILAAMVHASEAMNIAVTGLATTVDRSGVRQISPD